MPYIVYDTDRSIIPGGIHDTQAEANTKASASSDWTAYNGEIADADFPISTEPGWIITTAGDIVREIPPTTLEELKVSLRLAHEHLLDLWDQLNHEAAAHPWAEVTKVHDYFARIHPSNYQIVKVNTLGRTDAEIKKYADELVNGPQDGSGNVLSIPLLFSAIATAADVGMQQGLSYVSVITGLHVSITGSLKPLLRANMDLGAEAPGIALNVSEAELASGNWIELLT